EGGRRPDRAVVVYSQRCKEAYKGVPVIIGSIEASLRRIAHFDYWSETVRPSILVTSKADLVGFGMGERVLVEICERLRAGGTVADCRDLRGVAYLLGSKEELPAHEWRDAACDNRTVEMPSLDEVKQDHRAFAEATRILHHETNPQNGRRLTQRHGDRVLVVNPPALALDERQMDAIYDHPYTRRPHPRYQGSPIPAHTMIKDSVTTMRGCFGGCTFCSITMHQGRAIQSRSQRSILDEVRQMAQDPEFKGHISDVGGPTANMYQMRCTRPEIEARCRRLSCVHPTVCKLLGVDHGPTRELLKKVRETPGVKSVRVASGIRMDLARFDDGYLEEMAKHHVGGQLKVAPEHTSQKVLDLMKKPAVSTFDEFAEKFHDASRRAGKEQYLIPYFIAAHPGTTDEDMLHLAQWLRKNGFRADQVQAFYPSPMATATAMF
ncbi:MAG: YgiQ family radical SAM protein, partial [Planctomycetes bacterium]|nr:YgiQ family radical SAM protein [Planctomycetota bacterium]